MVGKNGHHIRNLASYDKKNDIEFIAVASNDSEMHFTVMILYIMRVS